MKTEYDYFLIDIENLKGKKTFPFQLYIYNPSYKKYSLYLNGNSPLTKDHVVFLLQLIKRGGRLAILKNQRKTFLVALEISSEEIPSLKESELHPLEKERLVNIQLKEKYDEKVGVFSLATEFEIACQRDNFYKIIENARVDILTFSIMASPTVSLALHLAKTHLDKDNYLNRIVAVSYHLAKNCNILEEEALADIICGAYLGNIGLTQTPLTIARTPYNQLPKNEKILFQKHTILGHHLIKKSHIDLSERCKKIILEHHERSDGSGFPTMKYGEQLEHLSQIVGAVSHLFEYSSGKITGNHQSMKSVILAIKEKSNLPGLEYDFGDKVYQSIITLINTDRSDINEREELKAA